MKETELNFLPHPNTIFATKLDVTKTEGGIILPNSTSSPSPVFRIVRVGSNVKERFKDTGFTVEEGDLVYADASYLRFAEIESIKGVLLSADSIIGKITK